MVRSADKAFAKGAQFLLSADLKDNTVQAGRRTKAKQREEKRKSDALELSSEAKPRTQGQWLEDHRKATKLPRIGGAEEAGAGPAALKPQVGAGDGDHIGKKKAKRLAVLALKKSRKDAKKEIAERKAVEAQTEGYRGKAKVKQGQMKDAAAELLLRCQPRTPAKEQRLLATVADRIASAPDKEIDLFDVFFELHLNGSDARTKQLALLSAVAVFKDLVPAYKIREPSEAEKAVRRSKEVLHLEKSELGMLYTYRKLLPALEAALKKDAAPYAPALAALTRAASDFNYAQRLIQTAVRHANSPKEGVRRTVIDGLQDMVQVDQKLAASREVVLAIGRVAQNAAGGWGAGSLQPDLLQILMRLPVGRAQEAELHGDENAEMEAADDETRRGFAEASIRQSVDVLRKGEAELLYEVFVVYLRIIRQRHIHTRELIAAALGGLAKWGQQVNIELLLEILVELKQTVRDAITATDELVALQGLHCAFILLSGPSQALITDATWLADAFTSAVGICLPSLFSTHTGGGRGWPPDGCYELEEGLRMSRTEMTAALEADSAPYLLLRCLEAAMSCPHGFSKASDSALAAVLEHFFFLAATSDSHVSVALAMEAASMLKRHRRLHTLLDIEGGLFGLGGVVDRAVTVVWPLHLMACSLAPVPARIGRGLGETILSRTQLLRDLFPRKDSKAWLESEFPQHLASLLDVPRPLGMNGPGVQPSKKALSKKSFAAFWSEADLRIVNGS